ncbi:MAG: DUF3096 domain-containing protein [Desulfobacterales bacterium]
MTLQSTEQAFGTRISLGCVFSLPPGAAVRMPESAYRQRDPQNTPFYIYVLIHMVPRALNDIVAVYLILAGIISLLQI